MASWDLTYPGISTGQHTEAIYGLTFDVQPSFTTKERPRRGLPVRASTDPVDTAHGARKADRTQSSYRARERIELTVRQIVMLTTRAKSSGFNWGIKTCDRTLTWVVGFSASFPTGLGTRSESLNTFGGGGKKGNSSIVVV